MYHSRVEARVPEIVVVHHKDGCRTYATRDSLESPDSDCHGEEHLRAMEGRRALGPSGATANPRTAEIAIGKVGSQAKLTIPQVMDLVCASKQGIF